MSFQPVSIATGSPEKEHSLKVYIQQTSSNYLYSAAEGWVPTVLQADTFASSLEALSCCLRKKMTNVHIRVHSGPECGFDTVFSVEQFPNRTKVPAMP